MILAPLGYTLVVLSAFFSVLPVRHAGAAVLLLGLGLTCIYCA